MGHTLTNVLVHVVFAARNREKTNAISGLEPQSGVPTNSPVRKRGVRKVRIRAKPRSGDTKRVMPPLRGSTHSFVPTTPRSDAGLLLIPPLRASQAATRRHNEQPHASARGTRGLSPSLL